MSMANRLKKAREQAGYKTATDAIEKLKLISSTYRAHENGQNNFNIAAAEKYAKAFGVSAAWLLIGVETEENTKKKTNKLSKYDNLTIKEIAERVYALSLLLRDDAESQKLVDNLQEIAEAYKNKVVIISGK
jgi:transcriptional regulator with XRE-family HTH domain